jgi:hypothetical protein
MTLASSFINSPIKPITKHKRLRINKADADFLRPMRTFGKKGNPWKVGKGKHNEVLIKFGGKPISEVQFYRRKRKLAVMGAIRSVHPHGNIRAQMEHYITDEGLRLISEYEAKIKRGRKKVMNQMSKSDESNVSKVMNQMSKSDEPSSMCSQESHVIPMDAVYTRLLEEYPSLDYALEDLAKERVYRGHALNLIDQYGYLNVFAELGEIKKKGGVIKDPGAYLTAVLQNKDHA